jgi:hypothetical protein
MKRIFFVLLLFSFTGMAYCQNDTIKASFNGNTDIREYVQKNVMYPPYAVENGIDGTVFYSFKVTKEGCVDSILFKKLLIDHSIRKFKEFCLKQIVNGNLLIIMVFQLMYGLTQKLYS